MRQTIPFGSHWIYDRIIAPRFQRIYDRVVALQPAGVMLDVGCGPGHLVAALAKHPDRSVVGVDLDPTQVKIAKREHPNGDYRVADVNELPFQDDAFDRVFSTESFHHWADPKAGLTEIHRVLRPGGQAWIVEAAGDMSRSEAQAWSGRRILPGSHLVARLVFSRHGYTTKRLQNWLLPLIAQTPFGAAEVERMDGWWIVTLEK